MKLLSLSILLSFVLVGCSHFKQNKPWFEPKTVDLRKVDMVSDSFNTRIPEQRQYPFTEKVQQPAVVAPKAPKGEQQAEPGISSAVSSESKSESETAPKTIAKIEPKVITEAKPKIKQEVKTPEVVGMTAQQKTSAARTQRDDIVPMEQQVSVVRSSTNISFCNKINKKLSSVSFKDCLIKALRNSDYRSSEGEEILYTDFEAVSGRKALGRVLLLGGVHGDELTSVTSVFKWMSTLKNYHSGMFVWRVVPLVNPDGFFLRRSTRTNANGVDLNRNLPTDNWDELAFAYWQKHADGSPRKYPGPQQSSEPETKWLIDEINRFRPDVIVTVHAPYNLVDFDAKDRSYAPGRLGILRGKSLGTFPGSLGRYAGEEKNIPVVTIELPHSYNMPSEDKIRGIWVDLISWLRNNVDNHKKPRLVSE